MTTYRSPFLQLLAERGFDPSSPVMHRFLVLTRTLLDMPRHLSQHVGGFVISEQPLWELVPVENAAMPERTIIQWDKDDLEALSLLGTISRRRAVVFENYRAGEPTSAPQEELVRSRVSQAVD